MSDDIDKSRRTFLKKSGGALAGTALTAAVASGAHVDDDNTIKVALVGCGGRGSGAALNALATDGPVKIWAMADVFDHRLQASLKSLKEHHGAQIDVPPERQFIGLDAFQKAIATLDKGDVVILATPPAFRPIHFEYAVKHGCHVFMEKSFAVDAPGVRRVMRAGELAEKKNLKVAGGLMWRHDKARQEVIKRIHDGAIGDITLLRTYRMHHAVGSLKKPADMSELVYQISNFTNFPWLNGSFFVDWLIHNIDVCCWTKNAWPVAAQGQGGRQVRTAPGQMFDHFSVEYIFADGARMLAQARHMNNCWGVFSDFAHGTKGSARIMKNLANANPCIYKGQRQVREDEVWRFEGDSPNAYQVEHDRLFDAIRNDKPYNEAERSAKAVMTAILGRMAAHSGQMITFEEALASNHEEAPGLEQFTWDSDAPVSQDSDGNYPVAMPGYTEVM